MGTNFAIWNGNRTVRPNEATTLRSDFETAMHPAFENVTIDWKALRDGIVFPRHTPRRRVDWNLIGLSIRNHDLGDESAPLYVETVTKYCLPRNPGQQRNKHSNQIRLPFSHTYPRSLTRNP